MQFIRKMFAHRPKQLLIAIEEHYVDTELIQRRKSALPVSVLAKLHLGAQERLEEMDEAGIDVQVLSHAPNGLQGVLGPDAASLARDVNDRLATYVDASDRFYAFASLPTADPASCPLELERCVTKLGFKGALIHGSTNGSYLDRPSYWPLLECAEALDVPIYIHPAHLPASAGSLIFDDYATTHPALSGSAWGFVVDAATHAIRLTLSGALDRFPKLKLVLGHMGEGLPFFLQRIDGILRRTSRTDNFAQLFHRHFYITTSSFFDSNAFDFLRKTVADDRILFSVDWPSGSNLEAANWLRSLKLPPDLHSKVSHQNVNALLKLSLK